MRIFDQNNVEIVAEDFDSNLGYLVEDKLFVAHHEAVEAVEEVSHYEVVREYPNGGKDVEKVVEVEAVEAKDAWDEYEDIYRYVPYTEEELAQFEIAELKAKLAETDYAIIKIAEGAATVGEYADLIAERQAWRARINELEGAE